MNKLLSLVAVCLLLFIAYCFYEASIEVKSYVEEFNTKVNSGNICNHSKQ